MGNVLRGYVSGQGLGRNVLGRCVLRQGVGGCVFRDSVLVRFREVRFEEVHFELKVRRVLSSG